MKIKKRNTAHTGIARIIPKIKLATRQAKKPPTARPSFCLIAPQTAGTVPMSEPVIMEPIIAPKVKLSNLFTSLVLGYIHFSGFFAKSQ